MRLRIFKDGDIGDDSGFNGGPVAFPIILPGDPTQPLEAATKQYVDNSIATHANNATIHLTSSEKALLSGITVSATEINYLSGVTGNIQSQLNGKLNLSGGTLSGYLTLAGDPIQALHAATKQYVDTTISTATSNITGATVVAKPTITPNDFNVTSGTNKSWTVSSTAYLNGASVASFEVDWGDGSAVQTVTANSGSATISHTYNGTVGTTYTLKVKAIDSLGNKSPATTKTVTVIANQAPVINNITWSSSTLYENGIYTVTINASDPEGGTLTYNVTSNNSGVTIAPTATPNVFQVTMPSVTVDTNVTFTYTVNDGTSTTTQTENKVIKNSITRMCVIASTTGNSTDYLYGITIDSSGNIYVTGYNDVVTSSSTTTDFYIAKLDSNLNPIKQITINNNTGGLSDDQLYAITTDSSGNIYVAGYTNIISSSLNSYIAKLDNNLNPIKQITIANVNELSAITTDLSGNIYVAGSTIIGPAVNSYIAKLDSNLNLIKQITIHNTTTIEGLGLYGLSTDSFGNVYVAGNASVNGNLNFYIAKLDNNLNLIKQVTIANTTSNSDNYLYGITTDSSGNIYVAGYTNNGSNRDFYIAKLNSNLNLIKQVTIANTTGNGDDYIRGITTDSSGNIYVAGYTHNGSNYDFYIAKLNSNLDPIKQITIANTTSNGADILFAITTDSFGNIYVAGITQNGTYTDFYIAKLNLDNIPNGTTTLSGPINYTITTQTWPATTQTWPATTLSFSATTQTWSGTTRSFPATTQTFPAQITSSN